MPTKTPSTEALEPTEAERLAREATAEPEPEVRPEEFAAGIGKPVAGSAWPDAIVEELRKPLDPNRIRRRKGRGREEFEYLAGHDVKREANRIFGFGNWGHRIIELVEIAALEVERETDEWVDGQKTGGKIAQTGWHVGYRCLVRVWVRHDAGVYESDGAGFGDGVEYTAAARISACELALKEAETDALKRAFTNLGDQFGLILYAKADERRKGTRESNRSESRSRRGPDVRVEPEGPSIPRAWPEWESRFAALLGGGDSARETVGAYLRQAVVLRWGVPFERLKPGEAREAFQLASSVLVALEADHGDLAFHPDPRAVLAAGWASRWDGAALEGPPFRLSAGEADRPDYDDYRSESERASQQAAGPSEE